MSSKQTDGTNEGLTETVFPGERPFVLTRSSFPGTGQYVAHWLGDNKSAWEDLKASIIGIVEFTFYGISMIGADVCGFNGESNEELCARWMQLGAFYPLDRNHNTMGAGDQDPARPDWPSVIQASKDALTIRYKYLPFLYTSLHRAHMFGNSAIRPVFSVFPSDLNARGIDDQFFWSDKLLVAPVVDQGATSRDVYFPDSLWYDLLDGTLAAEGPTTLTVDAPIETIPLYVKGGSVLPYQSPSLTTVESRSNPFGLTIALDSNNFADGELYWDDGHTEHTMDESYLGTFTYNQGNLTLASSITKILLVI
ncbi:putative family 31 glucosidase C30D11.01c [Armadillidium vulgare]|nr:putative family 31 glucosidase C30D11.01c [Armadillidium vulgare]